MKTKTILIIGLVWPEPTSSAAGWRMVQLIRLFQDLNISVAFASAAQKTERSFDLDELSVECHPIELNNSSFDAFIRELNPDMVMFDRFVTEEQYGWRVAEQLPQAIRILDAEDFHGLRKGRELAYKAGKALTTEDLQNKVTKREIVSMYRCDLTLVISEVEMDILTQDFQFPEALLLYLPFLFDTESSNRLPPVVNYQERSNFMTIGNYIHPPNADSLDYLKNSIWPEIRRKLPQAELHIYGAYQSNRATQLHAEKEGFIIKGAVSDIKAIMPRYRVCLAPLRFGAGLKGKLFEALKFGTPAVMSSIAAEGLFGDMEPNGFVEDDPIRFSNKAIELYASKVIWTHKQEIGYEVLKNRFQRAHFMNALKECFLQLESDLFLHRQENFTGQLFHMQSLQASKYLSKWIEAKNQ